MAFSSFDPTYGIWDPNKQGFDGYGGFTSDVYPGPAGGDSNLGQGGNLVPFVTQDPGKPPGATSGVTGLEGGPSFAFGKVPAFSAPQFTAPTYEDAQNEPGYQFRLGAGQQALERSAAARGVLRTGGTLKDILEYGQNFGSQEYGNVYNRALQAYDRRYQAAKDQYAPGMAEWQLKGNAELQRGLAAYKFGTDKYKMENQGGTAGGTSTGNLGDIFNEPPPEWGGFTNYTGYW